MALFVAFPVTAMDNGSNGDDSRDKDKNSQNSPSVVSSRPSADVWKLINDTMQYVVITFALYAQFQQMSQMEGGTISPLSSNINFKELNREIPSAIKALVMFYKNPERFKTQKPEVKLWFYKRWYQAMQNWYKGVSGYEKPCSGIVLHGEPGCGKTEYIRAIAGEGIPVFALSGSEIKKPYHGASEAMIRNIYNTANYARYGGVLRWIFNRPLHPCVLVFLDEIDSIGGQRGGGMDSNTHGSILNQLLTLLDGTQKYENIVTVVATNRKDMLDSALVRSGRLDVKIEVKNPTKQEKKAIINKKFDGLSLKRSKSLDSLFDGSALDDLSTADCAHIPKLCNTILNVDALEKEENSKFKIYGQTFYTKPHVNYIDADLKPENKRIKVTLQPGRPTVGTKTFKDALLWMEKEKKQDHNPMSHMFI